MKRIIPAVASIPLLASLSCGPGIREDMNLKERVTYYGEKAAQEGYYNNLPYKCKVKYASPLPEEKTGLITVSQVDDEILKHRIVVEGERIFVQWFYETSDPLRSLDSYKSLGVINTDGGKSECIQLAGPHKLHRGRVELKNHGICYNLRTGVVTEILWSMRDRLGEAEGTCTLKD